MTSRRSRVFAPESSRAQRYRSVQARRDAAAAVLELVKRSNHTERALADAQSFVAQLDEVLARLASNLEQYA